MISFIYIMKSCGPSIDPCGTPVVIAVVSDLLLHHRTSVFENYTIKLSTSLGTVSAKYKKYNNIDFFFYILTYLYVSFLHFTLRREFFSYLHYFAIK